MNYGKSLGRYTKTQVETSDKLDLVIICYEKAILFLTEAKLFLEERQYEEKGKKVQRALSIVYELQASLDFEKGGEIARNLNRIYAYLPSLVLQGDVRKDMKAYDDAIRILSELKEAWEGISSQHRAGSTGEEVPNLFPISAQQLAA